MSATPKVKVIRRRIALASNIPEHIALLDFVSGYPSPDAALRDLALLGMAIRKVSLLKGNSLVVDKDFSFSVAPVPVSVPASESLGEDGITRFLL